MPGLGESSDQIPAEKSSGSGNGDVHERVSALAATLLELGIICPPRLQQAAARSGGFRRLTLPRSNSKLGAGSL
jgi:hypothetical protein